MRFTLSLIALAAAALLSVLAWQIQGPLIEADLQERAGQALAQAQVTGVGVAVDGRDLTLSGTLQSEDARTQALAVTRELKGVRVVKDALEVDPILPEHHRLTAQKLPTGRVEISGLVPTSEVRLALIQSAAEILGEAQVVDRLQVVDGVPDLSAPLRASLPYVVRFRGGEAEAVPGRLSLRGQAPDLDSVGETRRALETALPELELIVALRRDWSAQDMSLVITRTRGAHGDGVRLYGAVPNLQAHSRVVTAAAELWGAGQVQDELVVAGQAGLPDHSDCAAALLPLLPEIQAGVIRQVGDTLSIQGAVPTAAVVEELPLDRCEGLSPSVELPVALSTRDCQARLNAMLVGEPIRFLSASAEIAPVSDIDLVRLADTLQACPGPALRIEGHTDSVGDDAANLRLSERRAAAVRGRMVELGIPPERMEAQGFGEAQPVASNRSAAGRADNRRIVFTLLESTP